MSTPVVTPADLDRALAELHREIEATEEHLAAMGLGERVEVPFDDGAALVFGKASGAWRLLVCAGGPSEPVTLTTASKQRRIDTWRLLPALRAKLVETATLRLAQINEAVAEMRRFRSSQGGGGA